MPELRAGIVGLGPQGVANQAFIRATDGVQLVAVCDVHEQPRAAFLGNGNQSFASHIYDALPAMLAAEQLDIVVIATPWTWREPGVRMAMEANCHVMIENPVAVDGEELDKICSIAADHRDLIVCVNEQWRMLAGVDRLRTWLQQGEIGPVRAIRLNGKGRDANLELPRIMTHLLPLALETIDVPHAAHVNWLSASAMVADLITPQGKVLEIELYHSGHDVRSCGIEVVRDRGRFRLTGGFLETAAESRYGAEHGAQVVGAERWSSVEVPGVWDITPGRENEALLDPTMNPSFTLWRRFVTAINTDDDSLMIIPEQFKKMCWILDLLGKARARGGYATHLW